MAEKFHINKNGEAMPCKATVRVCRYGGDDNHYGTVKEAQAVAEKMNAAEAGGSFGKSGAVKKESKRAKKVETEVVVAAPVVDSFPSATDSGPIMVDCEDCGKEIRERDIATKNPFIMCEDCFETYASGEEIEEISNGEAYTTSSSGWDEYSADDVSSILLSDEEILAGPDDDDYDYGGYNDW